MSFQILKRKSRCRRKHAVRGEQYDGSRWELHKSYKNEKRALQAMEILLQRDPDYGSGRLFQYKMVEK